MKTSSYFLLIVNAFLAIGLTVLSFGYVQPKNCYNFCDPSYVIPCPKGSCYFGDQKAGWPFPAFVDAPGGGSPVSGWGLLGAEDPPLPTIIADVLFYSILIWIVLYAIQFFRHPAVSARLVVTSLSINAFLGAALWVFYLVFTFTMGFQVIGRGHRESVDADTAIGTTSVMGFAPRVSVPLDEVIEYYGDPDYVVFTSDGTMEATSIGLLLYWDVVKMFVELPQIEGQTYPVDRATDIERIIYITLYDDEDVTRLAGQPIREEKTVWTGYGNYQP